MTPSQTTSSRTLAGQCFCGAVQYAVTDAFEYAANCHCSGCRRVTGSAFKPFAGIPREKLRITDGANNLTIFGDESAHDTHCRTCGSLLYSIVRDGAFAHVTMGTLIDDPTIRPTMHIFVGSKAPWFATPMHCRNTTSTRRPHHPPALHNNAGQRVAVSGLQDRSRSQARSSRPIRTTSRRRAPDSRCRDDTAPA